MVGDNALVVMFADVSESTRLYEALGNTAAQEIVGRCLRVLTDATEQYGGQVVKTIGDEVMCVFPNALDAARAAGEMQAGVRAARATDELPFGPIRVRIGMHYGNVLVETGDVFGETVNIAARMAKLAKPDQIITTEPLVWALPEDLRGMVRYVDEQTIAGRIDKLDLYELIWEVSELTDLAIHEPPKALRTVHTQLSLSFQDQRLQLDEGQPSITIGRSEQSQLIVPSLLASRSHALIHYSRGRWVLRDQSVNGTFVLRDNGNEYSVLRDEHVLDGHGKIGIGERPKDKSEFVISYGCE